MRNRIEHIDLFRGIGIILMVMCHVGFGATFYKFCHAFHMPMFFLITGYFFRAIPIGKFVRKKVRSLIIPYCVFGSIQYFLWYLLHIEDSFSNKKLHLVSLLFSNTDGNLVGGALWFLTCLFFAEFIYYYFTRIFKKQYVLTVVCFLVGVLGTVYSYLFVFRLPWGIDSAFVGVLLIHIGFLIRSTSLCKLLELDWKASWVMFLLGLTVSLINGSVNMRTIKYSNPLLFWIGLLLLTVSLWNLCRLIVDFSSRKSNSVLLGKTVLLLENIGVNSIVYVCLNQFFISVITLFIDLDKNLVLNLIIFLLTMVLLQVSTRILNTGKLKLLIGKS